MCVPVIGTGEVKHKVALPNAVVRDAVGVGTPTPRKIDELNSGGDKHGAMRVHEVAKTRLAPWH